MCYSKFLEKKLKMLNEKSGVNIYTYFLKKIEHMGTYSSLMIITNSLNQLFMKKITLVMILTLMGVGIAWGQDAVKVDGMIFTIENSGSNDGYAILYKMTSEHTSPYQLAIPAEVDFKGGTYPVKTISDGCFKDDVMLKSVEFPNTLIEVGNGVFAGCITLDNVVIPASIQQMGERVFEGCTSLCNLSIEESQSSLTFGVGCFEGTSVYELSINRPIDGSFSGTQLKEVVLGKNIKSLEADMFRSLSSLLKVDILGDIKVIDKYAFSGCSNLSSIDLPETLKYIGEGAFFGCKSLSELRLPQGVTSIGEGAFRGIRSNKFELDCKNINYIGDYAFSICEIDTFVMSGFLPKLPYGAFLCSELIEFRCKGSIGTIGGCAFYGCSKLKYLELPEGLRTISSGALEGCTSLKQIIIPSSVTSIEPGNIDGNFSLEELIIKDGTKKLNVEVCYRDDFNPQEGKTIYHYPNTSLKKAYIGRSIWTSCSNDRVWYCGNSCYRIFDHSALESVTFGENGSVGNHAFSGCNHLREVHLNQKASYIGNELFMNCGELTSIDLPETVGSIGEKSFYNSGLREVIVRSLTPPETPENAFDEKIYSSATLHVPMESLEEYESTMPWILFNNIVGENFNAELSNIGSQLSNTSVEWFNLNGVNISCDNLPKGIYIRRQGTKVEKIAIK